MDFASRTTDVGQKSLGTYIDRLQSQAGELRRVRRPIAPDKFEITALLEHLDRRHQYPAVLFEQPTNLLGELSGFPLLSNLWATRERCAEMIGLPRERVAELGTYYASRVASRVDPVVVKQSDAPVQTHVYQGESADLRMLPIVRHFEMDLGPVLTMAHIMRSPSEDFYNITFAKTFPEGGHRAGFTIHTPHLARLLRDWEHRGQPFPIVNVLGHHPAFWMGSLALTPFGTNEYASVGAFLGEPLRLTPSVTWGSDFLVPADAEMIIEGEVIPGEQTVTDPFGEVSRQYQSQQLAPVMVVKAITHRPNAIVQDVFSGHREHFLLGLIPREGSVYNHLQEHVGNIGAVHLPFSGCGRFVCYISIKKVDEAHPKSVAVQALAIAPMFTTIVVVDDDIDVFNEEDVLWAVNTYADPFRDVDFLKNLRQPTDRRAMGANRLLIDATRPTHIAFPQRLRVPPDAMATMNIDEWLDPPAGS